MKYIAPKRKYLDSIILLILGVVALAFLGIFIKQPKKTVLISTKPHLQVAAPEEFIYLSNSLDKSVLNKFNIVTLQSETIYSTSSAHKLTSGVLLFNHTLYTHGDSNFVLNITSPNVFPSYGDYISPDGKNYITVEKSSPDNILTFSLINANTMDTTIVKTKTNIFALNKILGWSNDSTRFFYTTLHNITTQTPMQATDHWMQKVDNKIQPMSRVRTWIEVSTKSAEMIYQLDTKTKKAINLTNLNNLGIVRKSFYDKNNDLFLIEKDNGLYSTQLNSQKLVLVPMDPKVATASLSIVFDSEQNSHRFLHSDGTSLSLFDPVSATDASIYYASNSAILTPLYFSKDTFIFSLQDNTHYAGELLDMKRRIRTEFISQPQTMTQISSPPESISFISWLKNVKVLF